MSEITIYAADPKEYYTNVYYDALDKESYIAQLIIVTDGQVNIEVAAWNDGDIILYKDQAKFIKFHRPPDIITAQIEAMRILREYESE